MNGQILMNLLVSVVVPIVVALISSGKVANRVTKKMKLDDLSSKVDNVNSKVDFLTEKVESIDLRVEQVDDKVDANKADTYRTRILRFNGEIKRGMKHDEEEFNDCLTAIDRYETYCNEHPDYPNNKCRLAIQNVERVYKDCLEKNSF